MRILTSHKMNPNQVLPLEEALQGLGELLADRHLRCDIAVVGGAALLLRGYGSRVTRVVDVVAAVDGKDLVRLDRLPAPLEQAARDVAADLGLPENWLNPGPASLLHFGLPEGFLGRCQTRRYAALTVRVAGRFDQLCLKIYAAADQGPRSKHLADLEALKPSGDELSRAAEWCRTHDPSPGFRQELQAVLKHFGVTDDG
jgi:hypothetical protein